MTPWKLIFLQSKANDGVYDEASLPDLKWDWPRETWLQERRRYLRKLISSTSHGERVRKPANGGFDELQAM